MKLREFINLANSEQTVEKGPELRISLGKYEDQKNILINVFLFLFKKMLYNNFEVAV